MFAGTLLDNFRESAADMVMVVYLSMSFVDQQTICCMTRLNHQTVQKIQETVRTVKAIDRGTWNDDMLKVGGFFDQDKVLNEDKRIGSETEESKDSDNEDGDSDEQQMHRRIRKSNGADTYHTVCICSYCSHCNCW